MVRGNLMVLPCSFCETFVLQIVFWILNVYLLPQWVHPTESNFHQLSSGTEIAVWIYSSTEHLSSSWLLWNQWSWLAVPFHCCCLFCSRLFNGTSLNMLIHQTVSLPGKSAITLCIFQDCLLRRLLKLVWRWSHTLKLACPQEAGLSLTIWGRVELCVTFLN